MKSPKKNTAPQKPDASTIPSLEELQKLNPRKVSIPGFEALGAFLNDFNASKTTFNESDANFDALSNDELWKQLRISVCELDRCEGLRKLEQADADNDPDVVEEIRHRITGALLRRGVGQQAIDERCAKALSEKKEADLLSAIPGAEEAKKPERGNRKVADRRHVVRSHPNVPAGEMCDILDRERVPVPAKWADAGFTTWAKAYKDPTYRGRIDPMISKDKNMD